MSPPLAGPLLRAVAVACLLAGAVGVAAAHPIVLVEDRSLEVASGKAVEIPLVFHDVGRTSLTVTGADGFELAATVLDSDRDGSVAVRFDTAAAGEGDASAALSAEGGAVRNATIAGSSGDGLGFGEYRVTVQPPNGGRDAGTIRVTPGERTATPDATGLADSTGAPSPTATEPPGASGDREGRSLPWPPSLLLALFGPAVPVVALVGASRLEAG
ncbi:hypothetical protein [Halorarum halobium]|uniref:DUF7827 domain-containing protein n=1 Tax=Halorarum halobium TaxID=3075121 RepID=UPI0028AAE11D|nr:hypothetical protein [Halobaculum sp. XH14]